MRRGEPARKREKCPSSLAGDPRTGLALRVALSGRVVDRFAICGMVHSRRVDLTLSSCVGNANLQRGAPSRQRGFAASLSGDPGRNDGHG